MPAFTEHKMIKWVKDRIDWRLRDFSIKRFFRKNFQNHAELYASFTCGSPCESALRRDGSIIRHPPGRIGLAKLLVEVCHDRVYTSSFFEPQSGDTIIDAGANIGVFSMEIVRLNPACRVLAFEPFEENFQLLEANLLAIGNKTVNTYLGALAGVSGRGKIVDGGARSQDHRLFPTELQSNEIDSRTTVATYFFADALRLADVETIALFKCDIEGSEAELFRHAEPSYIKRIRRFAIEWHEHIKPGTLKMLCEKLQASHSITVVDEGNGKWGMVYAS
ncbi:MAG TPA: hypothetical protein DDZ51_17510 [Planctomycetaceae bacterium]|nr:hypothetical protein [Planctomycetaceae bacterium]